MGDLLHSGELQGLVGPHMLSLVSRQSNVGQQVLAQLSVGTRLRVWTKVMTFLLLYSIPRGEAAGLEDMHNEVVTLLRQPAVRRRLERELADAQQALPRPLLTYEQLLAFFVDAALGLAMKNVGIGIMSGPAELAARVADELLPGLAPDNPRLLVNAASAIHKLGDPKHYSAMRNALLAAERQGSDYNMADCAYSLAVDAATADDQAVLQDPPSTLLRWLQQGEAAHRRCKSVLPKVWSHKLTGRKMLDPLIKPWLQQLQREGDRWRPSPELSFQMMQLSVREYVAAPPPEAAITCDGCGKRAAQLRRCGGCKEVQYCR